MPLSFGATAVTNSSASSSALGTTYNGLTAGRGLVALIYWESATATISSVTATGESNMTLIGSPLRSMNADNGSAQIAYIESLAASGNKTVTVNMSAAVPIAVRIMEFSTAIVYGAAECSTALDEQDDGNITASITTGEANDSILGVFGFVGSQPTTFSGFSFAALTDLFGKAEAIEQLDAGAAGSKSLTATLTAFGLWGIKAAVFRAGATATVDQQSFRFGADDGSESTHTWLAAQNGNVTHPLASAFLARFLLQATGDFASSAFTLRAQKNGTGGYVAVPVGSGTAEAYSLPTWGAVGTAASGTTSCTPSYPAGISAATSKLFCAVTGRSNTANTVPTMPAGWTRIGGLEGGTGTWGVDTGTRRVDIFRKDTTVGDETGTVTVSLAGSTANTLRASIFRIEVPSGYGIDVELVTGADTSNDTSYSAAASANATFDSNRLVLIATAQNLDTGTATSRAISASGITFGTLTNRADTAVTNGNDHRHIVNTVPVSSGSGTVAPTFSYTVSAAASGPTAFLVLRGRLPAVTNELYIAPSSNIAAGGEATTNRLTGGTDTFVTGRRWDDENGTDTLDLTLDDFTEVEWSLNTQSPAANGDYWDFRVYAGASALTNYDVTPRLTLGSAGTQALEGGAVGSGTASGNLGVVTFPAGARAALVGDDPDLAYAYAEIERAVEIYLPMDRAATGGTQALAGNALAASLATGALSVAKALAGSAAGAATATGALGVAKPIAGAAQGAGTAAAALAVIKPLAGAATGAGSAAGLLALVKSLAGSATGAGTAAGDLSQQGQVDLLGAAIAQGTATGELAHGVPLTATAVAASVVAGALGVGKPLAGAAQGAGQASGALVLGIGLQAAAVGAGGGSGTLSTQGQVDLAGSAQGAGTAAGVLTLTVRLAGSATAAGSASGALASAGVDLAGNAQGRGQATAVLELQIPLTGAAIAQAQAQGGLALAVRLTGEAIAAAVATGRLSVNGDAIELSGAALASAQASGTLISLLMPPPGAGYPPRIEGGTRPRQANTARPRQSNTRRY